MEPKKNPESELKRNSTLYFLIGLTAVLCMSYTIIEWKIPDKELAYNPDLNSTIDIIEVLPPVIHEPEPPKPKIKTPPMIEIVDDDDKDIIETVIEPDDMNQDTEISNVSDIAVADESIIEEIPFAVIEDVPVFPGCENSEDKRACFQKMVQNHIRKHFRYPEAAQEMSQQGKVYVQFTVQKDGSIANLRLRGPYQVLEDEAARIISKLPKMTPGKQRGTPVKVPFAIPITFKLQ